MAAQQARPKRCRNGGGLDMERGFNFGGRVYTIRISPPLILRGRSCPTEEYNSPYATSTPLKAKRTFSRWMQASVVIASGLQASRGIKSFCKPLESIRLFRHVTTQPPRPPPPPAPPPKPSFP